MFIQCLCVYGCAVRTSRNCEEALESPFAAALIKSHHRITQRKKCGENRFANQSPIYNAFRPRPSGSARPTSGSVPSLSSRVVNKTARQERRRRRRRRQRHDALPAMPLTALTAQVHFRASADAVVNAEHESSDSDATRPHGACNHPRVQIHQPPK